MMHSSETGAGRHKLAMLSQAVVIKPVLQAKYLPHHT